MLPRSLVLLAALALAACGSSTPSGTGGGGGAATGGGGGATGGGSGGGGGGADGGIDGGAVFTTTLGPLSLGPGEERTVCVTRRLGNATDFQAGQVHTHIDAVQAELVVYRVSDSVEAATPADCETLGGMRAADGGTALAYSKLGDEDLKLPAGAGLTLGADQMVRLELHALNADSAAQSVGASVSFTAMDSSTYQREAGLLLISLAQLSLPPQTQLSVTGTASLPAAFAGTTAFELAGYTHRLGVDFSAAFDGNPVYQPAPYHADGSSIVALAPAQPLATDGGVELSCTFDNTTPGIVTGGTGFSNEACALRVYYAPARGQQWCNHFTSPQVDVCCPGPGC